MTAYTSQIQISTSDGDNIYHYCWICLKCTGSENDYHNYHRSTSFQMLMRYLRVDLKKLWRDDVEVKGELNLCEGCSLKVTEFWYLYQQFEAIRLSLNGCVQDVCNLIKDSKAGGRDTTNEPEVTTKLSKLRKETIAMCSFHLKSTPRVHIPKILEESKLPPENELQDPATFENNENIVSGNVLPCEVNLLPLIDEVYDKDEYEDLFDSLNLHDLERDKDCDLDEIIPPPLEALAAINVQNIITPCKKLAPPPSTSEKETSPPPQKKDTFFLKILKQESLRKSVTWTQLKCGKCKKHFPSKKLLLEHKKSHDNSFPCLYCDSISFYSTDRRAHMILHHTFLFFKDNLPSGTSEEEMNEAIESVLFRGRMEGEDFTTQYECPECEKSFNDVSHMKRHVLRMHFNLVIELLEMSREAESDDDEEMELE